MEQPKDLSKIYTGIILSLVLLATTFVFFWQARFFTKQILPPEEVCAKNKADLCTNQQTCQNVGLFWFDNKCGDHDYEKDFPDYYSAIKMKSTPLAENFVSYSPNGVRSDTYTKFGTITKQGNIVKAYLEIIADINEGPLTKWESIYMKIDYHRYFKSGGHLFRPLSLNIPNNDKTHLLYALNDIPYIKEVPYSEKKTPEYTDWFKFIESGNNPPYMIYISSLSPAKIESAKIYYLCESGTECKIEVK